MPSAAKGETIVPVFAGRPSALPIAKDAVTIITAMKKALITVSSASSQERRSVPCQKYAPSIWDILRECDDSEVGIRR